jgi:hypothetical protein
MEELTVFSVLAKVLLYLSPLVFCVGIMLLSGANHYTRTEVFLMKEISSGVKVKILPRLNVNDYHFHERLLKRRVLFGLACIACALIFFFQFSKF